METIETGPSIRVGDRTLTIVERTVIEHHEGKNGFVVSARKEPHTVRIEEPGREYSLSIELDAC
jgi:hypothetical protein